MNPNIAIVSGFMCAETDEEARAKAEGWTFFIFCLEYNGTHDYAPGTVDLWNEYQAWRSTDKAQKAFETGLIGSPETIRKKLREFEAAHIDQIILLNQSGKTTHQDICDSLALFAKEVMPHFREATWDEALDLVASRLAGIRDAHGGGALAGFGSAKCSNEEAYVFQKLVRRAFGTGLETERVVVPGNEEFAFFAVGERGDLTVAQPYPLCLV